MLIWKKGERTEGFQTLLVVFKWRHGNHGTERVNWGISKFMLIQVSFINCCLCGLVSSVSCRLCWLLCKRKANIPNWGIKKFMLIPLLLLTAVQTSSRQVTSVSNTLCCWSSLWKKQQTHLYAARHFCAGIDKDVNWTSLQGVPVEGLKL